ncbi:MAG TPA: hypothetical protein VGP63_30935 [Planctomycetaceae bacterium]|nr:hypothetical protein [Planctomycetaceae bacterium]
MPRCRKTDTACRTGTKDLTTAKVLAPEDVRAGDYVALLHVVFELPSFLWCSGIGTIRPDEPVRIPFVPNNGGVPLRVRSICLPFILVKAPCGKLRNLDVRRYRLARLDRAHARAAWKARKKSRRKRERV